MIVYLVIPCATANQGRLLVTVLSDKKTLETDCVPKSCGHVFSHEPEDLDQFYIMQHPGSLPIYSVTTFCLIWDKDKHA